MYPQSPFASSIKLRLSPVFGLDVGFGVGLGVFGRAVGFGVCGRAVVGAGLDGGLLEGFGLSSPL